MQWGDQARGMFSGYTGPRRRMQLFHGTNDTTISYNNYGEAIKQWTNVLELPTTPTSTDDVMTSVATYDRQYWENECGFTVLETWAGRNGTHSMAYEEDAILEFFGLDEARDADPEPACPGGAGGSGGMGGASGTGGAAGVGGGSGAGAAGGAGGSAGNAGGSTGGGENGGSAGMTAGSAGSVAGAGAGGLPGSGGSGVSGSAGAGVSGGTAGRTGSGGAPGTAGNAVSGGSAGRATGGSAGSATAGTTSGGGAEAEETPQRELDCGCVVVGGGRSTNGYAVLAALGLAFAAFRRRGTGRRR
jgi:acetylxylan esterase